MITQTQDTKEYVEPVTGINQSHPTFTPLASAYVPAVDSFGHKFKYRFISEQMKIAKQRLSENAAPQTMIQVGDLYLMKGNYKKAITYFLMAIDLKPDFLSAYEKILFACIAHNDHEQANKFFRKVLEVTKRRPDILHKYAIFKALIDTKNQDIEEALSVLDEAIKKNPEDFEAVNTYGLILLNLKNEIPEAKGYFEKSRTINPKYIHAINNLGVTHLRSDQPEEASVLFREVMEIDPSYVHSYQNLACLYVKEENYSEALETLTKAKHQQLVLDSVWEHKIGWLLLRLGRFDEAIIWYQKKLQEERDNDLLYNNLGVCYKSIGMHTEADTCFKRAVSLFKKRISDQRNKIVKVDHLKSSYNVGRSAIDSGDWDQLVETSDFILRLRPDDAFGLYLKGAYLGRTEKHDQAKNLFERAIKIDPNIPEIYPDYAFILSSIDKNYDASIELLEKGVELGFNTSLVENNLAHAYILGGYFEKANVILKKFDDNDLPPTLSATKGLLCFRNGDKGKGDKYYQKAIENFASKRNKQLAEQIWHFERALYAYNKKDYAEAKKEVDLAKELPESYVSKDLTDLLDKIKQHSTV